MGAFVRNSKIASSRFSFAASICFIAIVLGCASPGPPHAPSLNLPKLPNDLSVRRVGDRVELRFTAPARSTDNLALSNTSIHGVLCRQFEGKTCLSTGVTHVFEPSRPNARSTVSWVDVLPPELLQGSPRRLGYRVELFNAAKQSAGLSDEAFTVAGEAPAAVDGLQAEGTRLGVLLHWNSAPGAAKEILIRREDLSPPVKPVAGKRDDRAASNVAELVVSAADATQNRVLDTTARPDRAYRYSAVRRTDVVLGGRRLELSSAPSMALSFELHLVYPPPAPTGLTVAGFATDATGFAVDLIWQPVDDAGLLAGLAGYNVYREGARLNAAPVLVPAFHDATAVATERYRYSVTAVDGRGNESVAVGAVLEPDAKP